MYFKNIDKYLSVLTYLLGVGCVSDCPYVAVTVHNAVTSRNLVSFSLFLTVLVVRELIVLDVETELVGWVRLEQNILSQTIDTKPKCV